MRRQVSAAPRSVAAIVLGGGINTIPLYDGYEPGYKALVRVQGVPSITYPLRALRESRFVSDVCVVGSVEHLREAVDDPSVQFVPPGASFLESILAGITRFHDRELVLATTADLPLLTGAMVDAFIDACAAIPVVYETNLFVSVIRQEDFAGPFAQVAKIMPRFRDGTFSHGNLMLVQPRVLDQTLPLRRVNAMYAGRKSALDSALALGPAVGLSFVLGVYAFHVLTIGQMAAIASRRFGMGIIPVAIPYPEVALDLDEREDYRLVTQILAGRG